MTSTKEYSVWDKPTDKFWGEPGTWKARSNRLAHKLNVLQSTRDSELIDKYFMLEAEVIVLESIIESLQKRLSKFAPKCECGAQKINANMSNFKCLWCD